MNALWGGDEVKGDTSFPNLCKEGCKFQLTKERMEGKNIALLS